MQSEKNFTERELMSREIIQNRLNNYCIMFVSISNM